IRADEVITSAPAPEPAAVEEDQAGFGLREPVAEPIVEEPRADAEATDAADAPVEGQAEAEQLDLGGDAPLAAEAAEPEAAVAEEDEPGERTEYLDLTAGSPSSAQV